MRIGHARPSSALVRQSPLVHGRFSFQDEAGGSSPPRPTSGSDQQKCWLSRPTPPVGDVCAGSRTLTWLPLLVMAICQALLSGVGFGWYKGRAMGLRKGEWVQSQVGEEVLMEAVEGC